MKSHAVPCFGSMLLLLTSMACQPTAETGSTETSTAEAAGDTPNPMKNAYFGDLHVHTRYSFDAYVFDVRTGPDDAYRYAKGEAIQHADGYPIQLQSGALDFQAVTDHGIYLGVVAAMEDPESDLYKEPLAEEIRALDCLRRLHAHAPGTHQRRDGGHGN